MVATVVLGALFLSISHFSGLERIVHRLVDMHVHLI